MEIEDLQQDADDFRKLAVHLIDETMAWARQRVIMRDGKESIDIAPLFHVYAYLAAHLIKLASCDDEDRASMAMDNFLSSMTLACDCVEARFPGYVIYDRDGSVTRMVEENMEEVSGGDNAVHH